ncbi:unnamed protein product [Linum trigynum]|uniref:Uncharacterized protein n=1 Tax=Linum trigynum TaxID=586398 RepID=A0AAV2GSX0_9ROSI
MKDDNQLLALNRIFSKLKPGSNGDEDQARALGNSGSSLSLSRNRSVSLKLRNPFSFGSNLPKRPILGKTQSRARPCFAFARPCPCHVLKTRPHLGENTVVPKVGHGRVFSHSRPCFGPAQENLGSSLDSKSMFQEHGRALV